MIKISAIYVKKKYEKYHSQFILSYYRTPFMANRKLFSITYGDDFSAQDFFSIDTVTVSSRIGWKNC